MAADRDAALPERVLELPVAAFVVTSIQPSASSNRILAHLHATTLPQPQPRVVSGSR
jgi:hypothetical protein